MQKVTTVFYILFYSLVRGITTSALLMGAFVGIAAGLSYIVAPTSKQPNLLYGSVPLTVIGIVVFSFLGGLIIEALLGFFLGLSTGLVTSLLYILLKKQLVNKQIFRIVAPLCSAFILYFIILREFALPGNLFELRDVNSTGLVLCLSLLSLPFTTYVSRRINRYLAASYKNVT